MNLPLSNAVNPAQASALLTVSSPAPTQGAGASPALGGATTMREDFAQHFARMARQIQPRSTLAGAPPQRQHLATDTPHRSDARFTAPKPAHHDETGSSRAQAPEGPKSKDVGQSPAHANQSDKTGAAPDSAEARSTQDKPLSEASTSAAYESKPDTTHNEDNVVTPTSPCPTRKAMPSLRAAWGLMSK